MSSNLTDAKLSIGPMTWCNYCQQNVGGAIQHKAGCKTLTDAEVSTETPEKECVSCGALGHTYVECQRVNFFEAIGDMLGLPPLLGQCSDNSSGDSQKA